MFFSSGPRVGSLLLCLSVLACVSPTGAGPAAKPNAIQPPPVVTPEGPPPSVVAESAVVVDAVTGRILAGKNADQHRAVASTQKLLTALLVAEAGPLSDPVTIENSDTLVEPTKLYLKPGDTYDRGTLLKVILVRSANDAAMALARDVGGSVEEFSVMMNRRARSLGMMNSHFRNPHGLTEEGQFSTARDMAKLARMAYRQPAIRGPIVLPQYTFVHNDGTVRKLTSTNKLLKRFPYANGMKTGTTNASGKCLISSASMNGRSAIAVVLGSTPSAVWDDSEKLLRWALEIPEPQLVTPTTTISE